MALPEFLINPNPEVYLNGDYIVLDFETTNLDKGTALNPDNRIVCSVWGRADAAYSGNIGAASHAPYNRSWNNEFELDELIRDIEAASFVVAHNAKFELQWLERCGLDLGNIIVWDTMIGDYVLGGNRYTLNHLSLENCARRRFKEGKVNIISKMIKADICPSEIPESWLMDYCVQDVALTERLFLAQLNDMLEDGHLLPVMYNRCLLTPVLADIEKNGMYLDADLVRTRYEEVAHEYQEQTNKLADFTGINLDSRKQLAEYLYETLGFDEVKEKKYGKWQPVRTDKGEYCTRADVLERLKPKTAKQREFLREYTRYNELSTELSKYLRKFNECCELDGGHLTATFNQCNTQTHRLSSSGRKYKTQFQNFPRKYKPLFKSPMEGRFLGEADGSQLEFRVAAHLGRDKAAIADIWNGTDVHKVTADIIGVSRQDAKAHTFKPLYGGTSGTPEQQEYYGYFREHYPGIADTQQRWIDEALSTKRLRTEWGLVYYWPQCRMERSGYVINRESICNYPVQAFATAEIIPIALVFFWHRLRDRGASTVIVNTVHDSIIVDGPHEEEGLFHELAQQCLIDDVYDFVSKLYHIDLVAPLGCGVSTGSHWGSKEETVYTATPDQVSEI